MVLFKKKIYLKRSLPTIFAHLERSENAVADSFHIKKLCSRISSTKVHFLREKVHFAFLCPLLGGLGATHAVHLRLIKKRVLDFLLVIIEVFSLSSDVLRRYERKTIENRRFGMGGSISAKFSHRRGRYPLVIFARQQWRREGGGCEVVRSHRAATCSVGTLSR